MATNIGRFLLVTAAAVVLNGQTPDLVGEWVDSQGNRFVITQRDKGMLVECPDCHFEAADRIYDLSLKLPCSWNAGALEASQSVSGGNLRITARPAASGMIRLTLDIPGTSEPFDTVLARTKKEEAGTERPAKIVVERRQASASIGKWVPLYVYLVDRKGKLVAPEKEIAVQLSAEGGTPLPPIVKISNRAPKVPAGIAVAARQAKATATAKGLQNAVAVATGCVQKPASDLTLKMNAERTWADANGRDAVPVLLTLVDAGDTPATDGNPKQVGFEVGGVARLAASTDPMKAVTIAAGQCAEERLIVADSAGEGTVSAEFRAKQTKKSLAFRPQLGLGVVLLTLAGGLLGGFAAAGRNFRSASRWGTKRWVYWLLSACVGAVAIYLAYFYGLLQVATGFPSAAGFAFLAGLVGGFLGATALEKIAGAGAMARAPGA